MTATIIKCTEQEYHNDPCAVPSLSSSIAHTLLTRSPLHAWAQHPRLGGVKREAPAPDDPLAKGNVIHSILLEQPQAICVIDADNFRTKVAQELRDAAFAAGQTPILAVKYDAMFQAAKKIRLAFEKVGLAINQNQWDMEQTVLFEETAGDLHPVPVACRARVDMLNAPMIIDVKSIRSADPRTIARNFIERGYDIQHAAYVNAVEKLYTSMAGRAKMQFAFCELEAPYGVYLAEPDGMLRAHGKARWDRAVRLWEWCLRTNTWPSYSNKAESISAPPWALTEEMAEEAYEDDEKDDEKEGS